MIVETKKMKPNAEKNGTLNVIYILLIFSGGDMSICVQTCMFNFQSQVPMDQINFFKLKAALVIITSINDFHMQRGFVAE